jgi:glycosyltransferase involved in cell wall biosynthesis
MELGGSQLNAIQLAKSIKERGHHVGIASHPGPLVTVVKELGLKHHELPLKGMQPSPAVAQSLIQIVRQQDIDLIHAYEWPPILESYYGTSLVHRTPVVGTIMSMSVASFLPRSLPLTVGTERIRTTALGGGYRDVMLLEPPVDTIADHPSVDGQAFRAELQVRRDEILVAIVCRLVHDLKLEGLLSACDAVGNLALSGHKVRLVIVGDGAARNLVFQRAEASNERVGRTVIVLTGQLADPSPAYAAADIVVGQGGSALRGMAFGKPLIVAGGDGFIELLTPESATTFLRQGWYGLGPASSQGDGVPALEAILRRLIASADVQRELGRFGRQLCEERFSLSRAATKLENIYLHAINRKKHEKQSLKELGSTTLRLINAKLIRRYHRWVGSAATDDCNSRNTIAKILVDGKTRTSSS